MCVELLWSVGLLWLDENLHGQSEGSVVYPCSQFLALLLLRDEVLGGHLQLKLSQLMLPAHCSKKQRNQSLLCTQISMRASMRR